MTRKDKSSSTSSKAFSFLNPTALYYVTPDLSSAEDVLLYNTVHDLDVKVMSVFIVI